MRKTWTSQFQFFLRQKKILDPGSESYTGLIVFFFTVFILAIGLSKGFPFGPWALFGDDGIWITIVRHWCQGSKLYVDVMDQKPPGYFLYLKPICLLPVSSDLTVRWEPLFFWLPILFGYGLAIFFMTKVFRFSVFRSIVFGIFSASWLWTARLGGLFSTEWVGSAFAFLAIAILMNNRHKKANWHSIAITFCVSAATLCNLKFISFFLLYPFCKGLSFKIVIRDILIAIGFGVLVCLLTIGWNWDTYRWLFSELSLSGYWHKTYGERIVSLFHMGLTHPVYGLFAPIRIPIRIFADVLPETVYFGTIYFLSAGIFVIFFVKIFYLLPALIGSLFTIIVVGTIWDHTLIQILPFGVAFAAHLTSTSHRMDTCSVFDYPFSKVKAWYETKWEYFKGIRIVRIKEVLSHIFLVYAIFSLSLDVFGKSGSFYYSHHKETLQRSEVLARDFSKHLGNKNWISILTNQHAVWLSPHLKKPINRSFHQYCWALNEWERKEFDALFSGKNEFFLALDQNLNSEMCKLSRYADAIKEQCESFAGSSYISYDVRYEIRFYHCFAKNKNQGTMDGTPKA